jgi:tripartite-type tricarboxylate transporter receptor subunit TctC
MKVSSPFDTRRCLLAAAVAVPFGLTPVGGQAQASAYPTKPIRIIVGFAAGGGSDFIARLVAQKLTEKLGQTVIVDNKPGAGGNLAAETALKSPPDGYTLFLTAASYTVNPNLYKLSFDPLRDITPIVLLARGPFVVAVNPKVPAATLKDFAALAKKAPGKYTYASAGNGSIVHMVSEYFLETADIDVLHVPYRGTSPALTDTIAGQTQLVFGTVASTLPFVKSGQLKALAVTTAQRLKALPDVPTVAEAGYPSFQVTNWHGMVGPKGLADNVVTTLNKAINEALRAPGMEAHLASDGLTAAGSTPAEFKALLEAEVDRWAKVAKSRGVKAD